MCKYWTYLWRHDAERVTVYPEGKSEVEGDDPEVPGQEGMVCVEDVEGDGGIATDD